MLLLTTGFWTLPSFSCELSTTSPSSHGGLSVVVISCSSSSDSASVVVNVVVVDVVDVVDVLISNRGLMEVTRLPCVVLPMVRIEDDDDGVVAGVRGC